MERDSRAVGKIAAPVHHSSGAAAQVGLLSSRRGPA